MDVVKHASLAENDGVGGGDVCSSRPYVRFLQQSEWQAICHYLKLSQRECEIAIRVLADKSEAQVAFDLGASRHTIHTHIERLYRKLGVGSRCALAARLFETYIHICRSTEFTKTPLASRRPISERG